MHTRRFLVALWLFVALITAVGGLYLDQFVLFVVALLCVVAAGYVAVMKVGDD